MVALLSRGGETQVETAGGAEPDTIFRIASMSKPVVRRRRPHPGGGVRAPARRPGRRVPARARLAAGADPAGRPARRHRARRAADHAAGPADVPARDRLRARHVRAAGVGAVHGRARRRCGAACPGPPRWPSRTSGCGSSARCRWRPAGHPLALQHRLGHPRRAHRAGRRAAVRRLPAGADLRAAGHDRHRVLGPAGRDQPAAAAVHQGRGRGAGRLRPAGRAVGHSPGVPVRRGRAGLHRPRLPRVRVDADGRRQPPGRPDPVAAVGLADDLGPAAGPR